MESGAINQAAMKRTKQIMQIRKQDSYSRAIGGSFEDDHTGENREPVLKMRKQVWTKDKIRGRRKDHFYQF
jgi:hypothetical protein